jgi:hypothetical protein
VSELPQGRQQRRGFFCLARSLPFELLFLFFGRDQHVSNLFVLVDVEIVLEKVLAMMTHRESPFYIVLEQRVLSLYSVFNKFLELF